MYISCNEIKLRLFSILDTLEFEPPGPPAGAPNENTVLSEEKRKRQVENAEQPTNYNNFDGDDSETEDDTYLKKISADQIKAVQPKDVKKEKMRTDDLYIWFSSFPSMSDVINTCMVIHLIECRAGKRGHSISLKLSFY